MADILNSTCVICGKKYHCCNTCKTIKTFKPWRTITDSIECYKIYLVIHDYTNHIISKIEAKERLENCNIPNEMQPHIQTVIDDIMLIKRQTKNKKKGITDIKATQEIMNSDLIKEEK